MALKALRLATPETVVTPATSTLILQSGRELNMAKGRASGGGVKSARDVNNYCPPQGPSTIDNPKSPGLHGTVYRRGVQGPAPLRISEAGRPGLGGENKGKGVNRRG